ncbi:LPXTG cell wall anchor domain-containing protein [Lacticaseibacillus baoqingensis]|uniref:LPXTG cell wall anchor domain-containing protein n=1 Tax=Lacticaseibacillus baoqingensis TaxID=2486013 RepID=A0ABW4E9W2_9LACO|nr:LPXTG cell wall anchor domain-containing protein [Lacticaseibacillus baoqingensis]
MKKPTTRLPNKRVAVCSLALITLLVSGNAGVVHAAAITTAPTAAEKPTDSKDSADNHPATLPAPATSMENNATAVPAPAPQTEKHGTMLPTPKPRPETNDIAVPTQAANTHAAESKAWEYDALKIEFHFASAAYGDAPTITASIQGSRDGEMVDIPSDEWGPTLHNLSLADFYFNTANGDFPRDVGIYTAYAKDTTISKIMTELNTREASSSSTEFEILPRLLNTMITPLTIFEGQPLDPDNWQVDISNLAPGDEDAAVSYTVTPQSSDLSVGMHKVKLDVHLPASIAHNYVTTYPDIPALNVVPAPPAMPTLQLGTTTTYSGFSDVPEALIQANPSMTAAMAEIAGEDRKPLDLLEYNVNGEWRAEPAWDVGEYPVRIAPEYVEAIRAAFPDYPLNDAMFTGIYTILPKLVDPNNPDPIDPHLTIGGTKVYSGDNRLPANFISHSLLFDLEATHLQYQRVGTADWTATAPTAAGTYRVRVDPLYAEAIREAHANFELPDAFFMGTYTITMQDTDGENGGQDGNGNNNNAGGSNTGQNGGDPAKPSTGTAGQTTGSGTTTALPATKTAAKSSPSQAALPAAGEQTQGLIALIGAALLAVLGLRIRKRKEH